MTGRGALAAKLASVALVLAPCGLAPSLAFAADDTSTFQLEVVINGHATGKIAQFVERNGGLLVSRADLADIGLRVPAHASTAEDGLIALASLPGVAVRLDTATQTLYLTAGAQALQPQVLHAVGAAAPADVPLQSGVGATLNYDVSGGTTDGHGYGNGLFDLRVFSPFGVASTQALAYAGQGPSGFSGQDTFIRLDSAYVYSDFANQRRYGVGDFITGGLSWTRPVRLGGVQVTRDFTMRPDLVTFPLPSLAGSVAVPSTVDVLVNGSQVLSRQVQTGPFNVPQLPVITGAGSVQMTVTNALGQQVTTSLPFYASNNLLAPGLYTWSAEAGFVRRDWGVVSNDYGAFAGAGTYRRGLSANITIEAHAEGTTDEFMAGGGIVANAFNFAVINLGAAASSSLGQTGGEISVGIQREDRRFSFGASAILATSNFRDIAAMNGDPFPVRQISANATAYLGKWGSIGVAWIQVDRETAVNRIGAPGLIIPSGGPPPPVGVGPGGVALLPFLPSESAQVLTGSYSVQVRRVFFYANAFHDFAPGGGSGASIGVTVPLGRRTSVTVSANAQDGSAAYGQVQAQRSVIDIGDWGYDAYLSAGNGAHEFGQLQYKSPWALVTAGADDLNGQATLRLDVQGAISFADGRLFASNTINDSFAVVDTGGAGGVHVLYENRPQGVTDDGGRLLVPELRAWEVNHLSIDPADVPVDAQVPYIARDVRPPDRSGVVVKFPIQKTHGALLVLVDETGRPIPVGSTATLEATGAAVTVGYDGEAFIEGLAKENHLVVQLANDGRCVVDFAYVPAAGDIPKIGPLTCRKQAE